MDFSKLPYDISKPGKVIDNYPELADYPQFANPADDTYVKLAILITDENSPIVRKEKNFKGIVVSACSYLGIEDAAFIEAMLLGFGSEETTKVFNIQSAYFRLLNQWEYSNWYDMMFQYYENSLVLRTPLDPSEKDYEKKSETKQKIRLHQMALQKDLVQYENQIFPKESNIKKVITKHVAKITTWPERMAKDYSAPQ